jgi:hypothetical protein
MDDPLDITRHYRPSFLSEQITLQCAQQLNAQHTRFTTLEELIPHNGYAQYAGPSAIFNNPLATLIIKVASAHIYTALTLSNFDDDQHGSKQSISTVKSSR